MDGHVASFLERAASHRGVSTDVILSEVFHLTPGDRARVAAFFPHDDFARGLFESLDDGLRVRNPNLHYVFRTTYLGYRREEEPTQIAGERTQIFVSVRRSARSLGLVLPLNPEPYRGISWTEDMAGRGHHGVGELMCRIRTDAELKEFFATFEGWLASPSQEVTLPGQSRRR